MAFANANISDLMAAGLDNRTTDVADNALNHNPIFYALKQKGKVKTWDGGIGIMESINYGPNANAGSYSGYDPLPTNASDNLSAALYEPKQYSVTITVSGREARIQNAGRAQLLDLVEERVTAGMDSLYNTLDTDACGDGTGNGGKALTGLGALVENTATGSQTSTVGGISRANFAFWRNQALLGQTTNTPALLQAVWNSMWALTLRGSDSIDTVIAGSQEWGRYLASLQAIQRFTNPETAQLGFQTLKYMNADVYCGAGIGSAITSTHVFMLNTKYLRLRPHSGTNMITLPDRYATNQDAFTKIVLWAGNVTCRGPQFQGRIVTTT